MKKFLTLVLAIVMVLSLSVNAFAIEYIGTEAGAADISGNKTDITVTANTQENPEATVYRVDIA